MAVPSRRVVITGIGIISPIGLDAATFWRSLHEGRSGVRPIRTFDASGLPVRFAGEIPDFDAKDYVEKKDRKSLRVMARTIQLAVAAAQRALDDGQVDKSKLDPTRFGVEFGAGLIATELPDLADAAARQRQLPAGPRRSGEVGRAGLAGHPAAVDAQVSAQHARLSRLDPARRPGAQQQHHRERRRQPAGPGRGVPHPGPRPGRLLPGRRRREQDQPAEHGSPVPVRAAVAPQRDPGEGVPAVRPRPRRPGARRGGRRVRRWRNWSTPGGAARASTPRWSASAPPSTAS